MIAQGIGFVVLLPTSYKYFEYQKVRWPWSDIELELSFENSLVCQPTSDHRSSNVDIHDYVYKHNVHMHAGYAHNKKTYICLL